ncbi:MAG: ribosome biogenesis GTP-binding protein YihA/YsxC [Syntrophobacterales bacterium]|nr:ribosome biogenesis GTP-binding protein YihA/YsxC [Syntrophobacterales bacterium]
MAIPKITQAEFVLGVHRPEQLPAPTLPEAAFLGRSNVGKSSLINCLLGRKGLVRVSRRPGCTQALNFYRVNEAWYFVDLPGYGYAQVSRARQARWGELILGYFQTRPSLKAVVFLMDPRRRPAAEELYLWERLRDWGRTVIPVLTKADKLKASERAKAVREIARILGPFGVAAEELLWFSALTHEGRDRLWGRLLAALKA